jgi:hypothetical protein
MRISVEEAFDAIEGSILPSVSMMLDTLLDSAALARSGVDSEDYAAELRVLALQLDGLTRDVEGLIAAAAHELPARICA